MGEKTHLHRLIVRDYKHVDDLNGYRAFQDGATDENSQVTFNIFNIKYQILW